jgi:hypothetical protein
MYVIVKAMDVKPFGCTALLIVRAVTRRVCFLSKDRMLSRISEVGSCQRQSFKPHRIDGGESLDARSRRPWKVKHQTTSEVVWFHCASHTQVVILVKIFRWSHAKVVRCLARPLRYSTCNSQRFSCLIQRHCVKVRPMTLTASLHSCPALLKSHGRAAQKRSK